MVAPGPRSRERGPCADASGPYDAAIARRRSHVVHRRAARGSCDRALTRVGALMVAERRRPRRDPAPTGPEPTVSSWPGPWASGWAAVAAPARRRPPTPEEPS